MGEFLFRSGAIDVAFRSCDTLIGKVRGRQYYLSIALTTFIGALAGSAMGVAAMLGRSLYPAMVERGYDSKLTIGTILGGASLAPIIPPSVLVIIIGALANTSISALLIAGNPSRLVALGACSSFTSSCASSSTRRSRRPTTRRPRARPPPATSGARCGT